MKKLIVSAAVLLGSLSTFATITPVADTRIKFVIQQEDYTEVKVQDVPDVVKTALKTVYPDATLDKAYVNAAKEYKLEISVKDQKATVYADANGNWINK
ncbi:MAG TPA: hypothetical protein VF677_02435 [Flavobacterium sp.]|jgi:hypothetical protein